MIFSTNKYSAETRNYNTLSVSHIKFGENGLKKESFCLTVPNNTTIKQGLNENLTISKSLSRNDLFIDNKKDNKLYLILSSKGNSEINEGDGLIAVPKNQYGYFKIIDSGCGCNLNNQARWSVKLFEAPKYDCIIKVKKSGYYNNKQAVTYYLIHLNNIYICNTTDDIITTCNSLKIQLPCIIENNNILNSWATV